jgi:hypothetical protein
MPAYEIPDDLIAALTARRVIPFIGAGFSAGLNLPGWEDLLKKIAEEVEDSLTFEEVNEYCRGDNLQIAEYYLLKSDRSIGPLRHTIARAMTNIKPLTSAPHIELVNLGAQLIYTTNYDEAIELTYRQLHEPVTVVALPKHVATLDTKKTQVVKYHGDLRHEKTLVLTESSYYSRLDFESPMDLKFRSDILGRSVLFMGYSFRDLNIRVIWYRLMRMMKDIHPSDLPTSYIVIFSMNPVLELLYREVGIRTIVLDPRGAIKPDSPTAADQRNRLFGEFLLDLASRSASEAKIPGQEEPQYVSHALLSRIEEAASRDRDERSLFMGGTPPELSHAIIVASSRRIPYQLAGVTKNCLARLAESKWQAGIVYPAVRWSLRFLDQVGHDAIVTFWIARGLGYSLSRRQILAGDLPWAKIWSQKVDEKYARYLLAALETEIRFHDGGHRDEDLAYLADVAMRIKLAQIVDETLESVRDLASATLDRAADRYPSISSILPMPDREPNVDSVIAEIERRTGGDEPEPPPPDDIPF